MKIAVISPIAGLQDFSTMSRTHLVLAQIQDKTYREFYLSRRRSGDFIILDNGAYEGATFDAGNYLDLIKTLDPQVVVLPDTPYEDGRKTFLDSLTFMKLALASSYQGEFMAVPQATLNDWHNWWLWTRSFLDIKEVTWIGLSKLLKRTFDDFGEYARAEMAKQITKLRPGINIHALGMLDGSFVDFDALLTQGIVKSLDTGAPVWRGWNGYTLTSCDLWPDIPLNFSADPPHPSCVATIYRNLSLLGVQHDSRVYRRE